MVNNDAVEGIRQDSLELDIFKNVDLNLLDESTYVAFMYLNVETVGTL